MILQNPEPKDQWKKKVKSNVQYFWKNKLQIDALNKNSLRFLNPEINIGKNHPVWNSEHPREVRRAQIKAKFLTGTYMLQTTKYIFGEQEMTCPLCLSAPEGRVHILTECAVHNSIRKPLMNNIQSLLPTPLLAAIEIINNNSLMTQLLLDPSHKSITDRIRLPQNIIEEMEKTSKLMIYQIHYRRAQILGYKH